MNRFNQIALAAALAVATVSTVARADIITSFNSVTQTASGTYAYTYNVQLAGTSQLIGTATAGADGVLAGTSEFGTVYDFGPVVNGSNGAAIISATGLMASFNYTFNNSDTPAATSATFRDDPTLGNIRFTYLPTNTLVYVNGQGYSAPAGTAELIGIDPGSANLGTFTIESVYGPTVITGISYDGSAYKSTNNTGQQNLGQTAGPLIAAVPEPASFALLGAGLLGLGMMRRRNA